MKKSFYSRFFLYHVGKLLLDRIFAILLMPFFLIIAPLIAVTILLDSPGFPLFLQKRVGANGREFTMLKFRTMRLDTPNVSTAELNAMGIDPVTRVGRFLRRTSLDEVPQLLNIVFGEMSFIGPRPALASQHDILSLREEHGICVLRPGVTGLAQVRGRDDLTTSEKIYWETVYYNNMSFLLDFQILFETFSVLISNKGNR